MSSDAFSLRLETYCIEVTGWITFNPEKNLETIHCKKSIKIVNFSHIIGYNFQTWVDNAFSYSYLDEVDTKDHYKSIDIILKFIP